MKDISLTPRETLGKNRTSSYEMRYVAAGPGARWAGAASDGAALWDGTERLRHIPCVTAACQPHQVAFSDDGRTLFIGPSRFDVDSSQGTHLDLRGAFATTGVNEVMAMAWATDGEVVVASTQHRPSRCCRDRDEQPRPSPPDRLLVLDGRTGALVRNLEVSGSAQAIAASARQIVADTQGGMTVWDRATFTPTVRADAHASRLYLHSSGSLLASVQRGEVTLWRLPDFCPFARFTADPAFVHALAFHPTAPVLFTAGTDHTIRAFSTDAPGQQLASYTVPGRKGVSDEVAGTLVVTSDGRLLAAPIYMEERVIVLEIGL